MVAAECRAQGRLVSPCRGTSFVADVVFHGQRKEKNAFRMVMEVQVSYRPPLPALISCHAMILCFLSQTCCVPCDCAEWCHMADEVRGEMQQLLPLLLITFNCW